nr:hypothetical protein [Mycobacterium sp.]
NRTSADGSARRRLAGGVAEAPAPKAKRRPADGPARPARTRTRPQEPRGQRQGPQSIPAARPAQRLGRPKSASQAKARAKARKAKAPKVIRVPLRERLLNKLAGIDLSPRSLIARVPFVVLVIGALAMGLGITLWLSTDAAQRSYQLGNARALNDALAQQKEALERDVLEAQSAPALADAARNLGMIPSRDTAHLVKDPAGNWIVVGQPKAAEGAPPPPLNTKLPDEKPPAPVEARPVPAAPKPGAAAAGEVPVVLPPPPGMPHTGAAAALPGPVPAPGATGLTLLPLPAQPMPAIPALPVVPAAPAGDTLAVPPAPAAAPQVPTVAVVPPVTDVAPGVPLAGLAH